MKTLFMFSGMGSQYRHMGHELYVNQPRFRQRVDELDYLCQSIRDISVVAHIFDSKKKKHSPINDFTTSAASLFVWTIAMVDLLEDHGIRPDALLGSSLGLYVAATAAGCWSVEEGLRAVFTQSELFTRHCVEGAMFAVLAPLHVHADNPELRFYSEIGAINSDSSFVLSMPARHVGSVEYFLRSRNIAFQRIDVQRAFHSRWLESAKIPFFDQFDTLHSEVARLPLLCCSQVRLIETLKPTDIWSATRNPILFRDSLTRIESIGPWRYIDVGPSGTLANMARHLLPSTSASITAPILTPFGNDTKSLNKLMEKFYERNEPSAL